jgi:polysaccharide chain length determinant protein (PEP-CTERM system associated)
MKSTIKFYLILVWRRLPAMVLIVLLAAGLGVAVAVQLPNTYSTSARLLVEGAAIPDELAASTVRTGAAEQLDVIQQRLMTRANLIDIANKHDVFPNIREMTPDAIVERMRNRTEIRSTSGRDRATLMTISFEGSDPRTAANVVNEYVTLILDENVRFRTNQAEDTEVFFSQEVDRLSNDLDIQKDRILRFKQQNADALPDNLEFRLNRQSLLQERVAEGERRIIELTEQKERLIAIYEASGTLAVTNERDLSPEERQLRELRQQLDQALIVYSEENPRVRLLRTRVEQLETALGARTAAQGETATANASPLDIEVGRIDAQVEFLRRQLAEAEAELETMSDSIARTPANAIALEALERDYANIQGQYNAAISRLAQAQTGERIELLSKGQRIAVLEQASIPTDPTGPNRPRVAQAGVLAGFAMAGGLFLLLEMLNTAIRRPKELTTALGITPFAVLSYIETDQQRRRRRVLWMVIIGGLVTALAATAWALHTYYLPMDLLITKVVDRLGLNSIMPF